MSEKLPDGIEQDDDGTYTIQANSFFGLEEPITGIPTLALAERVLEALWDAENIGSYHY